MKLYVTKHRSQEDIDDFGFLKSYKGILVHDHYTIYYNYGAGNAECNVHALRYLNGASEFTKHTWAKELKELLLEMKGLKEQYIDKKLELVSDEEFDSFTERYLSILHQRKEEMKTDYKTNAYRENEKKLLNRLIKIL